MQMYLNRKTQMQDDTSTSAVLPAGCHGSSVQHCQRGPTRRGCCRSAECSSHIATSWGAGLGIAELLAHSRRLRAGLRAFQQPHHLIARNRPVASLVHQSTVPHRLHCGWLPRTRLRLLAEPVQIRNLRMRERSRVGRLHCTEKPIALEVCLFPQREQLFKLCFVGLHVTSSQPLHLSAQNVNVICRILDGSLDLLGTGTLRLELRGQRTLVRATRAPAAELPVLCERLPLRDWS
mmetsp:Transcript_13171/g.37617  ORF Transcript_13171/g.37617 Transcript_13171/m.37617 type:complete len:235 (-) Transcript_13171:745-1449(-)